MGTIATHSTPTRAPTRTERRLFFLLPVAYAALVLAVLPFATMPGSQNPEIAAVSGAGILFADVCTAFLLAYEYRRSGRAALLSLTAAYAYSAAMALLHVLTFPGALIDGPVIGNTQTVAWLFVFWRLGMTILLLGGILTGDAKAILPPRRDIVLAATLAGAIGLAAVLGLVFAGVQISSMAGNSFGPVNYALSWVSAGLSLCGALLIWRRKAYDDALYLWLGLAMAAFAAEQALSLVGGARYSVGWYVSRASWVISSCVLLVLWLSHESSIGLPKSWRKISEYGSAICILIASLILHWFLLPWLGYAYPFTTSFGSVAIAVWLGGWGPAMLTALVGYVVARVWFTAPIGAIDPGSATALLDLVLYALTCSAIIGLGEAMRRARYRHQASELDLRRIAQELQLADTKKSQFLAVLSHELRNPMAPLRNSLEALRMNPDPKSIAQLVPIMDRQLGQLSRLVDDLLDVSRIDLGRLELKRERVAMDDVLKRAVETAKPRIEAKNHELVVQNSSAPIYVDGDPVRLAQLISNLLINAARFTPPGGHIEASLRAGEDQAIVEVRDSGIGIPAESLSHVFEMFVQLDPTHSASDGGLGLGLALSRAIAEMHGGRLDAHSEGPGKGSRFVLRLPRVEPAVNEPQSRHPHTPASARRRVLVVDDNHDAATTLGVLLELEGHEVRVAHDGAEALLLAREFLPHVAFIDLNMPGMDGIALAGEIRNDARMRDIKLVALTGMGRQSDVDRTRDAGFVGHLSKPASMKDIARFANGLEEA